MENSERDEMSPVRGLLDSDRVARYLGVERVTIRSWMNRKAAGGGGFASRFPDPLPERLGGTALWDVEDIKAFKPVLDGFRASRSAKGDTTSTATESLRS